MVPTQEELDAFVRERFFCHFGHEDEIKLASAVAEYRAVKAFRVNENIHETGQKLSVEGHYVMRLYAMFYMGQVLDALKIDREDPNVMEDAACGNIGTAGRIAKMYTGAVPEDERELMSGRWNPEPRMATFPNNAQTHEPVFVTTQLDAVCSHHFIRFGQDQADRGSVVVVGYIPREKLGGISKINRFVNWCARRGWLQEDLTRYIGKKIMQVFETDSVYVALFNLKHGCTAFRGACDINASTSTTYVTGAFEKDRSLIPLKFQ
ncbi:MAG: GTP cyclohydrolase I [Campylobacterales bacterium]|nr:GTP cyclohydrolase I [Campylobacterales bacterium]